jgi:outer membrane protein assembly factor BamB
VNLERTCLCICLSAICPVVGSRAEGPSVSRATSTWPQWRGPRRNGHVSGPAWPLKLDSSRLQPKWRHEIAEGYPGPIVSSNRVFTVETHNKKTEIVRAFGRDTGEEVWQAAWDGSMKVPFFASRNGSWVRSTPAYDGGHLYVAGMRDVLVCLDAATGAVRWRVDFMERFGAPLPKFGFVCSPLVADGAVYIQAGASFVKLDKTTGATLWRTLEDGGGMYGSAFSSPVLGEICGVSQLLVQTRSTLAGVDPQTGSVLWRQAVKAMRGMNILTPVVLEDNTLFTSSYGGATILHRLGKTEDGYVVTELWKDKRSQGYMSTPVVSDGFVYFHRRDRRFSCLDPRTREILWTSKERHGQYCSLVCNGKTILGLNDAGELLLIQADPRAFVLLDRRKIASEETWGHLTVADDQVFVRELRAISAFRWRESD